MKVTTAAIALVAALSVASGAARAQSLGDKALAETLFQQGRDLFDAGKTDEACLLFEQSQRLEEKLGTLLNLAVCHEKQGRTATAWAEFTEAAAIADKRGEAQRAEFARERVKALAGKLSHVVVSLAEDAPGLVVSIDGSALSVHGVPLPLDPGTHKVEARATGRRVWATQVEVPPGPSKTTVQVPALALEESPPPVGGSPPVKPPDPPPDKPKPPPPDEGEVSPAAWVLFGVGGAGIVLGAITGGVSLAKTSDLEEACNRPRGCPPAVAEDLSSANTLANVSNVSFVVGGASAVAGLVVLLVTLPSGDAPKDVSFVSVGDAGLGVRGRF